MTGFLQSLAGMAVGELSAGAARASLPPRFAAPPRPLPPPDEAITDGENRNRVVIPHAMPDESRKPDATVIVRALAASEHPVSPAHRVEHSTGPVAFPSRQPPEPRVVAPESDSRHDQSRRDRSAPTSPMPQPAPSQHSPRQPAIVAPVPPSRPQHAATPATIAPPSPAARAPVPLSPSVLAMRVEQQRDSAPVINITIDRIDVRAAPAEAAKPPPRRSRTAPSQSLADYLRAGRTGALR